MIGLVQPLFGAVVILAFAVAFSKNRRAINWTTVAWGLSLQVVFALIVLKTTIGSAYNAAYFETLLDTIAPTAGDKSPWRLFAPSNVPRMSMPTGMESCSCSNECCPKISIVRSLVR